MDDGTRISEEVERFLRAARAKDVGTCSSMLLQNPELANSVEAGGFCGLHFAAFNGDLNLISILLSYDADIELKNYDGNTPLMLAAKGRQTGAIKALVDAGALINYQSSTGVTAAHFAASMGDVEAVSLLSSLGAEVIHNKSATGSLLHWAAHSGDINCVGEMLYSFNIPMDIQDEYGGTAIFTAIFAKQNSVVQFLLEHGANPQIQISNDYTTPLHIAVEYGTIESLKSLLAFNADPDVSNLDGISPRQIAEEKNLTEVLVEISKPRLSNEARKEEALRLKNHGNKVFADREYVKATKLFTLAIQFDPNNHVLFSNRSACYFDRKLYSLALYDACRCIELKPTWSRGYFRKAATLLGLKKDRQAYAVIQEGLSLDPESKELCNLQVYLNDNIS